MLEFKKPEWLKKNLGKVSDRIGKNGSIEIDEVSGNKVFLRLINEDYSFEVLPASIELSQLINNMEVNLAEVKDFQVLELTSGYICIGQIISFNVSDLK